MKSGLSSPDVLIDIGSVEEMGGVRVEDDTLVVGATTSYDDFLEAEGVHEHAPAMTAAVEEVGDTQVRNRGTVGGNLAHADPASDLPAAALVSELTMVAQGPDGEREIPVEEFFFGMYATALAPDELLTRVEIPSAGDAVGAYAKKASPSSGYAMTGVAAMVDLDGDTVESAKVGANGVMDHGVRLEGVEEALAGASLDADTVEEAAERATEGLDTDLFMSDLQASAPFREQLLSVYTKRALNEVADRSARPAAAD
jgi:carbon-monoxide dehydrogenase medium subunit